MSEKFTYIDIHGHLNFAAYDAAGPSLPSDREDAIKRAQEAGVAMITVGTQIDTSQKAVELAETHENMWAAIGLHPIHTSKSHHDEQELGEGNREFTSRGEVVNIDAYRELAKHPKVVAIGECGLDYYRLDSDSIAKQRVAFESMIDIANEANKPLMLHLRNGSDRSAYNDAFEIIKSRAKVKGDLHFFAGSIEEAKPFLDLGFYFSFTGVVTFTHDYDAIIKFLPLDRIMSETDCPYVAPKPYRGKRNEPAYVVETIKAIARIRGEDETVVARQLLENARHFFGIS
jgi:TatD DNase family protein